MTAADGVATRKHHLWITNGHQIIQAAGVHGIRNYRYSLSSNWVDSHWSPLSSWSIMMMIMMITIIIVKNMVWTCCAKPWILIITIGAVNGPITEVLQTFKRIFCILNQFSPELKCISSPLGIGRVQKLGTGCLFIITSFFYQICLTYHLVLRTGMLVRVRPGSLQQDLIQSTSHLWDFYIG